MPDIPQVDEHHLLAPALGRQDVAGNPPELGGVQGLRWRRWSWRLMAWPVLRRWRRPRPPTCGALRSFGAATCSHEAGWRTAHPGQGRCYLHGERSPYSVGRVRSQGPAEVYVQEGDGEWVRLGEVGELETVPLSEPLTRQPIDLGPVHVSFSAAVGEFQASLRRAADAIARAHTPIVVIEGGRQVGRTEVAAYAREQLRRVEVARSARTTSFSTPNPEAQGLRVGGLLTTTIDGRESRSVITAVEGDTVYLEPTVATIIQELADEVLGSPLGPIDLPSPARLRDLLSQDEERAGQLWVQALQRTARGGPAAGHRWRGWHPATEALRELHEAFLNLTHGSNGQQVLARGLARDMLQRFEAIGIRPRR